MSIQPDHWIRRMALEARMIEPFEEKLVRQGVISYGLSSFGYDIRVADEFLIFTPATGQLTAVDPKAIDDKAMMRYQGDICIIPPNSFALARSVEYFRMPRTVLGLCLGKSTYARCFRGDTRIALVDGTSPTLEEMAKRAESGALFWGYSVGSFGRIQVTLLEAPRYIGRDELVELTLDDGSPIHCTPDHIFILRDGRTIPAGELRPGDSLMPLYRQLARGYEMVYQPLNGQLHPTHRLADEWNVRHGIYQDVPGTHRHHQDHDRLNNNPWNITRMEAGEHIRHHNAVTYGDDFDPDEHGTAIQDRFVFRRFPNVLTAFRGTRQKNHKVQSIRELRGVHDVFCLTVPEAGNFALAAGVFVSNCGIITNFTPFEPGWEGHVTIEISNTTPLPAKIYANEGIAQVLFFEGDEPEVTYADRQGKYQAQTGITLPRL
jgi:dCTP deaminase